METLGITPDLSFLPADMDIPAMRRLETMENVQWLLRNLTVNNGRHKDFEAAIARLKAIVRLDEKVRAQQKLLPAPAL